MNDECIIIGHLSLNDLLIINGIVNYYTIKYNKVYLLCKKIDFETINQMFSHNNLIIPISIDMEINNNVLSYDSIIFKEYEKIDIIKIGMHNPNWDSLKSDFIIENLPYLYFKTFYEQLNLDYEIRYKYEKINRNILSEKKLNNEKYKFVNGVKKNDFNEDELFIFDPCDNPVYPKISNNILDYCTILENSYEIHLSYNYFFSLCMLLDLSKVKNKYIYTSIINIKEYHKNAVDWKIIYTI